MGIDDPLEALRQQLQITDRDRNAITDAVLDVGLSFAAAVGVPMAGPVRALLQRHRLDNPAFLVHSRIH